MTITVIETNCIGCGSCVLFCPGDAMQVSADFVVQIDPESCTDCQTCIDCCSNHALETS